MPLQISTDDEQAILEVEKETFEAIRSKDAQSLRRILADDFVYRSPNAEDADKEEFIRIATGLPVRILSVWGENLRANIYGETAVLTGVQHAKVETEDSEGVVSSVAFTDIFAKRDGNWRMVLAYGVELSTATAQSTTDRQ